MKRLTTFMVVCMCTALLGFAFAAPVNAQTQETSLFTLTEPLDVGGTILQPGDYRINVVTLAAHRNMLQISSADQKQMFATVLSIPHPEGPGSPKIPASRYVYYPATGKYIKALRTWYAAETPGLGGHDIVYTKERATEYAALVNEPVVAAPDNVTAAEYKTAPLYVVTPAKEVKPYEVAAVETAPAPEPPVKMAAVPVTHKRLPGTASDVPLYAGLGVLSLLGALGLAVLARRVA
jgi:hypothetical protein